MNVSTLEEFIKEYKGFVAMVVNSMHSRLLDDDDLSEIQYHGLWKVWKSYDSKRFGASSLKTYITTVVRNYCNDLIRKKKRWGKVNLCSSIEKTADEMQDLQHSFSEEEWKIVQPYYEGKSITETCKELKMGRSSYIKLRNDIFSKRFSSY